jgi:hypothetical protein
MGAADDDYGDLDDHLTPSRPLPWVVAGVALLAACGFMVFVIIGGDSSDQADGTSSSFGPTSSSPSTTEAIDTTSNTEPPAWAVSGDNELPPYITDPVFYEPGTAEAAVEVAYVNAEISSLRALAEPIVPEPEVEQFQTGFALNAIEQSRQILLEDGQFIVPGELTRIEIEDITVIDENEADIESCLLAHSISIVTADPSDQLETIRTLHTKQRMVRNADGQWQLSELVATIQDVNGFGSCLDVGLTPVDPSEVTTTSAAEPEVTSG